MGGWGWWGLGYDGVYGRFANEDYGRNSCYHLVVTSIGLILDPCTSFAHIVRRMDKLESLDVKLFCATAMDFYRTLVRHVIFESCFFFLECRGCLKYCILSVCILSFCCNSKRVVFSPESVAHLCSLFDLVKLFVLMPVITFGTLYICFQMLLHTVASRLKHFNDIG